jgi:hypothetical protein
LTQKGQLQQKRADNKKRAFGGYFGAKRPFFDVWVIFSMIFIFFLKYLKKPI